jgi:L-alanine-DL-glutamate epimerase-like enolase superfamily enzyme
VTTVRRVGRVGAAGRGHGDRTWERIAGLELAIDDYGLERLEAPLGGNWVRTTTVIHLLGGGSEGLGEDVTYANVHHDTLIAAGPVQPLTGSWTLASFSDQLATLDLFADKPENEVYRRYRRWAFESAALDLALRQAGVPLHAAVGREPAPLRFVASLRLDEPPTLEPIELRLAQHGDLKFKLDPTASWDDALIEQIAALDAVAVVDLKGFYSGTTVDNPPEPGLYRRVAEGFPAAWIEDPGLTEETDAVLLPHRGRITWDAPIHTVADVRQLPFAPRMLNVKPSRMGSLRELFELYDYCAEQGIGNYGGGQTELGVGRGQIQYLAALFHPDAPNDVAPAPYNLHPLPPRLPGSPLVPSVAPIGFRWE